MIKLVIFDLWKTLIYKNTQIRPSKLIHEHFNLEMSFDDYIVLFENITQTKSFESREEMYTKLLEGLKLPVTKENIKFILDVRNEAESKIEIYNHSIEMLQKLREKGFKTGLISNSTFAMEKEVEKQTNVIKYIDYPIFSFKVGKIKPAKLVYDTAVSASGFKPEECLMVGDNYEHDVLGAEAAGLNAIHFKNWEQLKEDFKLYGIEL